MGGFPIRFGGSFLYDTYPDVSCMYLASCMYHEASNNRKVISARLHELAQSSNESDYKSLYKLGYTSEGSSGASGRAERESLMRASLRCPMTGVPDKAVAKAQDEIGGIG